MKFASPFQAPFHLFGVQFNTHPFEVLIILLYAFVFLVNTYVPKQRASHHNTRTQRCGLSDELGARIRSLIPRARATPLSLPAGARVLRAFVAFCANPTRGCVTGRSFLVSPYGIFRRAIRRRRVHHRRVKPNKISPVLLSFFPCESAASNDFDAQHLLHMLDVWDDLWGKRRPKKKWRGRGQEMTLKIEVGQMAGANIVVE